jgi:hypothetical protein
MLKSEIPSPRRQPCIGARSPIQQHASPIHDSILDTLDLLALRGGCSKVPSELKITRCVEERAQVPRIRSWGHAETGRARMSQAGLRERYRVPKELPPNLQTLVLRVDAVEGNQLLGYSGTREQMIDARRVGGIKAFPDWFVLT